MWSKRKHMLAVTLIGILYLLQAVPLLNRRWVADESWYALPAYTLVQEGRVRMSIFPPDDPQGQVDTRPTGMYLALAAVFKAFGTGVIQARIPSVVAGLATVVLVYALGVSIGGALVGTLAALVVATDNFLFLAAHTARPEAGVACFATLTALFFWHSYREKSPLLAFLSGLALGVALMFHPAPLALAGAFGLLLIAELKLKMVGNPRPWAMLLGFAIPLVAFVIWATHDRMHLEAAKAVYLQGEAETMLHKLAGEAMVRYSDFLGFGSQRFHLPFRFPLRIHIVAAIIAAFVVLYRKQRPYFVAALLMTLLSMSWFAYMVNKSSRYLTLLAPIFALAIAMAAAILIREGKYYRTVAAVLALIVVSQTAGNIFYLYRFRTADYPAVSTGLRRLIPPGRSAYGSSLFWEALHDHDFYAYDRTSVQYARSRLRPDYVIMNDRVMVQGSGYGEDDYGKLRGELTAFVARNGVLVGNVPDPYYGDLQVYRMQYDVPSSHAALQNHRWQDALLRYGAVAELYH